MPSVNTVLWPKARKVHTCCECSQPIVVSETYHLFKGCWDGEFKDYKTCLPCHEMRSEVADGSEWPPFGDLGSWVHEYNHCCNDDDLLVYPPVKQTKEAPNE